MPVYCIRVGQHGPVKLGWTDDPAKRRGELQTAHWEDLHILRLWEGGETEERMLHARFASLRLKREWFSFSSEMLGDVGLTEIIEHPTMLPDTTHPNLALSEYLRMTNQTQSDFATAIGVNQSAVQRWLSATRFPRGEMLTRIIAVTKGALTADSFLPTPV